MPALNRRARWRQMLYTTKAVNSNVVVLLLALSEEMDAKAYVDVVHPVLAERLNLSERVVAKRITQAVTAGILDRIRHGGNGRPAHYQGTLPNASSRHSGVAATAGNVGSSRHVCKVATPRLERSNVSATLGVDRGATSRALTTSYPPVLPIGKRCVKHGRDDDAFLNWETIISARRGAPALDDLVIESNPNASSTKSRHLQVVSA